MTDFILNDKELEEIEKEIKRIKKTYLMLHALSDEKAKQELMQEIAKIISSTTRNKITSEDSTVREAYNEIVGIGIFEKYMENEDVTDVSYDGNHLWITTSSGTERADEEVDVKYVEKIIKRFADTADKEFTEKNPSVDVQFENIRLQAHHRSISTEGTVLSIRMARNKLMLTKDNFKDTAPKEIDEELLSKILPAMMNLLISGGTGSGKTELVKYLFQYLPDTMKMVIIEDIKDGHYKTIYPEKHIVSLLTNRSKTAEQLIVDGLRMHPRYLTLSEARAGEFYDLFMAAGTGHAVLSTLHAIDAFNIPERGYEMVTLVKDYNYDHFIRQFINRFRFGIQMEEVTVHGKKIRYIKQLVEYTPEKTNLIFGQQRYTDKEGIYNVQYGELSADTMERFEIAGIQTNWNKLVKEKNSKKKEGE